MPIRLDNIIPPPYQPLYQTNFERLIAPHANYAKIEIKGHSDSNKRTLFSIQVNSIRLGFKQYIQALLDSRFITSNMAAASPDFHPFDIISFKNEEIVPINDLVAAIKADLTNMGYKFEEEEETNNVAD